MPLPIRIGTTALLVLILAVLAGCGDGGEETDAPTKAAFVKEADAICSRADEKQEEGLQSYTKKNPVNNLDEDQLVKVVMKVGMPPLEEEAEELDELTPPAGDEEKIESMVQGIEGAIDKAMANPQSMASPSASPFRVIDEQAKAYGFQACSDSS
jgi:hypothetical protein